MQAVWHPPADGPVSVRRASSTLRGVPRRDRAGDASYCDPPAASRASMARAPDSELAIE